MTMNSTTSELVQDNSNVSPETNPMDTVQSNELIFGQKHNDIDCALCPTAKRACDRAWLSAKQVENWSEMSKTTLWRWLERIEKAHRISRVSDMKHVDVSNRLTTEAGINSYRRDSNLCFFAKKRQTNGLCQI